MPKAINISMNEYNTGLFKDVESLVKDGRYILIIIDDANNRVRDTKEGDIWKRPWMTSEYNNVLYCVFDDSDGTSEYPLGKDSAAVIASDIRYAYEKGYNLIVSCVAGLSRSGAVVEAAIAYGFEDTGKARTPNSYVKSLIMEGLGIGINSQTSVFNEG